MELNDLNTYLKRAEAQSKALSEHYSIVSFSPDGKIIDMNDNFLNLFGYEKNELIGQHHRILCPKEFHENDEYRKFWQKISEGKINSEVYKRIKKNGEIVYIMASYKPLFDEDGFLFEILKYAQDVTDKMLENINYKSLIDAINKSTAIIEFDVNGNIINANENFLKLTDYSLDEIKNKNHSIFCEENYTKTDEYKLFWEKLKSGSYDSAEYTRYGKNHKKISIRASYNPVYDLDGNVIKITKLAQDITKDKVS